MNATAGKLTLGLALLVGVWIGVYWWWPTGQPPISFDQRPESPQPRGGRVEPARHESVPTPPPVEPESNSSRPRPAPVEPAKQQPVPPKPAVIPPRFTRHTVERGDTLESISRKYYGTSRHAQAIAKANSMMDTTKLKIGRELLVPKDPANIQGIPTGEPSSTPPNPGDKPSGESGSREYVVRDGDTLSEISKRMYGTIRYTDVIYEANKDVLSSPDGVKPGQKLRIPPKPES